MLTCIERPTAGAIGFEIFIVTGLNLATATDCSIWYEKPGGGTGSWTAEAHSAADDDGVLRYGARYVTTAADDLDEHGDWRLQVGVEMPGFTGRGKPTKLKVLEAIGAEEEEEP
jgi:hypothetical protein